MTDAFGYGQRQPNDFTSRYNSVAFVIRQFLAQVRTAIPVQVVAVSNSGGVEPVGTVDVQPMVNQLDGNGNATPHGTIFSIPYLRAQGGSNAIIMDPEVGDIGLLVVADRDSSSVKANKARSNPGSFRKHDLADGFYVGGFLNGTPTQIVRFHDSEIDIVSTVKVTITAPTIFLDGAVEFANTPITVVGGAPVQFSSQVKAPEFTAGTINLTTHRQSGVQTGGGTSGPPTP